MSMKKCSYSPTGQVLHIESFRRSPNSNIYRRCGATDIPYCKELSRPKVPVLRRLGGRPAPTPARRSYDGHPYRFMTRSSLYKLKSFHEIGLNPSSQRKLPLTPYILGTPMPIVAKPPPSPSDSPSSTTVATPSSSHTVYPASNITTPRKNSAFIPFPSVAAASITTPSGRKWDELLEIATVSTAVCSPACFDFPASASTPRKQSPHSLPPSAPRKRVADEVLDECAGKRFILQKGSGDDPARMIKAPTSAGSTPHPRGLRKSSCPSSRSTVSSRPKATPKVRNEISPATTASTLGSPRFSPMKRPVADQELDGCAGKRHILQKGDDPVRIIKVPTSAGSTPHPRGHRKSSRPSSGSTVASRPKATPRLRKEIPLTSTASTLGSPRFSPMAIRSPEFDVLPISRFHTQFAEPPRDRADNASHNSYPPASPIYDERDNVFWESAENTYNWMHYVAVSGA
ncbi:hypothetical protein HDU97_008151 [Phlyctochytrium planicorne]|nr:hypothetical protein HDU97_008151 [Phlyctochytrium planicorne]